MADRKRHNEENESGDCAKKGRRELIETLAAFSCRKGERDTMLDTHVLSPNVELGDNMNLSRCSFFAIFDGHVGGRAAEFCQNNFEDCLKEKLSQFEGLAQLTKSLKSTFTETYKQIDDKFIAKAKENTPVWKDGTTASTMIIFDNVIYVANVGDSKVIVARRKEDNSLSPICLTADHNPMIHEERMRIQKTGATVRDGRVGGVIEISRSIGDVPFKSMGVISTPSLKKLIITKNDLFAIIACDGLWKSFSNVEAVNFVNEKLNESKKSDIDLGVNEKREHAELRVVAEQLAAEAVRRKCGDNVSVILVKLSVVEEQTS